MPVEAAVSIIAKTLLRLAPGVALSLMAGASLAQEGAEAAGELDPGGPGGITTLIFLLGVAGILIVGGVIVARDSFRPDDDGGA